MPARRPDHTARTAAGGRRFHLLWLGEGVSLLGSTSATILLPLLAVTHLHAGPGWMGALTAATWLPWLAIGLPAGAWVDAWPVRRVMVVADLVSSAVLVSIPLAAVLGRLSLAHLVGAALVSGVAGVFFRTAYVKLIPLVVPDAQLDSANARLFGTEAAAMVVGPGLAGRLSSLAGPATGLLGGAVGFLVSAGCLLAIRGTEEKAPRPTEAHEPLLARVRAGVEHVLRDPYLRWLVVIGGLSNLGLTGYGALMVLYLVGLGLDDGGVGGYFMVGALGGVLGSVVGTRLSRHLGSARASTVLLLSAPAALLVGLPTARTALWVSVLGYVAVGAAVVAGNVIRGTWRQRYVPPELLGRVLTAMATINYGTMPLAGVLAGWLGSAIGVRPTILLMAGVHVVACGLVLVSPLRGLRELPLPDRDGEPVAAPD